MRPTLAGLAGLVVAALLALGVAWVPAAPAVAQSSEQATIAMPFAGQWANQFGTAPWQHHRGSFDWAMDVFAVDAAVRVNVLDATGEVDLEVTDVVLDATCGGTGGSYVTVRVSVDGTEVGSVLFHHLVKVKVAEGDRIAVGSALGRTVTHPGALSGGCWHVSTPMGIHTHMAVVNEQGHSCFVRHQIGQSLGQAHAVGVLGHSASGVPVGAGPRSDCADDSPPRCHGLIATIVGTTGHDQLVGTEGPDVIVGLGGRDTIHGLGGDDTICAGSGADEVDAGDGDDYVNAGLTADTVWGGPGDDHLIGGKQDDLVDGGPGHDRVIGRSGDDELLGGAGDDELFGNEDADLVLGQGGADRLLGGDADDVLRGGAGEDRLAGKDGHDRCLGGAGQDRTHRSCEIVARTP